MLSSLLRVSDWAGLEWGLRVYGSNIFPEDAQSAGPGTHTGKPLLKELLRRAWSLPILAVTSEKEISKWNGLNSKFFATMIIHLSLLTCLLYLLLKINLTLCIDPQSGRGVSQGHKISLLSSFLWPPRLFFFLQEPLALNPLLGLQSRSSHLKVMENGTSISLCCGSLKKQLIFGDIYTRVKQVNRGQRHPWSPTRRHWDR